MCKRSELKRRKLKRRPACSASTITRRISHQDGGLLELGGHLHAGDGGPGFGLDALDHRAAAAALLLLIGHDFTVRMRHSLRPAHLPQRTATAGSENWGVARGVFSHSSVQAAHRLRVAYSNVDLAVTMSLVFRPSGDAERASRRTRGRKLPKSRGRDNFSQRPGW